MGKATSVKDVDQQDIVRQIAIFLKKSGKVKIPEWVDLVKLGCNKELAPIDSNWFYTRTASVARRLYIRSPTGIGALRCVYGGNKRRGVMPNHFAKASGCIIRKALQTLESINWVEKNPRGKGRILTQQGRKDLDRIASRMRQNLRSEEA